MAGVLAVPGVLALLAACGSPPQPRPTAPPEAPTSSGLFPSSSAGPVPGRYVPGQSVPGGLPTTGYPTFPAPALPNATLPVTTLPTTVPTSPPPSPAGRCTSGPTKLQVLAVVKDRPGIPANQDLQVTEGPYCAKTWQFAIVGIVGQDAEEVEPLLVVTSGTPSALTLIEAGTDVCTDRVQDDAPPGIRVRACGA
jgi:hypothetical protein